MPKWERREIDRALNYYHSKGMYEISGNALDNYKKLLRILIGVEKNIVRIFDDIMEDRYLRAFLILHSVF